MKMNSSSDPPWRRVGDERLQTQMGFGRTVEIGEDGGRLSVVDVGIVGNLHDDAAARFLHAAALAGLAALVGLGGLDDGGD